MLVTFTAGVAMGISEAIGGDPALTAVVVILTGIVGAIAVTPFFNVLGLRDWRARGFAAGLAEKGLKLAAGTYVVQVGKRKFARVTLT